MKRLLSILLFSSPVALQPVYGESCSSILDSLFVKNTRNFELFSRSDVGLQKAGTGRLLESRSGLLEFEYAVTSGAVRPQGRVRVQHLKACSYRLTVTGVPGSGPQSEEVEADALFVKGGMLHFYFDRRRRFFQIDRKGNETRMVTEYGPVIFKPVAP